MTNTDMAAALGWFSIGLGAIEIAAPRWLGQQVGMAGRPGLIRAFGAREAATGAFILANRESPAGLWARVAGDAVDLAALGTTEKNSRSALAIGAVAGAAVADGLCARSLGRMQ